MPERKAFLLRLDPEVWAELTRLAQRDLRSINAEVEFLLREAIARRSGRRHGPERADDEDSAGRR